MKTSAVFAFALSLIATPVLAQTVIYPTLPGGIGRDYTKPGYSIDRNDNGTVTMNPTLPGGIGRDYTKPGYTINQNDDGTRTMSPTLPGGIGRDYTKPSYIVE